VVVDEDEKFIFFLILPLFCNTVGLDVCSFAQIVSDHTAFETIQTVSI